MTREKIINEIKPILDELSYPDAVSYLTQNDVKWLNEIIKKLEQEPCDDAVRRTEVIDELNRLGRNAFKDDTDYDNFFAFVDSLPSVTPQEPRWILVTERLPDKKGEYIVTFDFRKQNSGICVGVAQFHDSIRKFSYFNDSIIAWQPLPKPYSEVEE